MTQPQEERDALAQLDYLRILLFALDYLKCNLDHAAPMLLKLDDDAVHEDTTKAIEEYIDTLIASQGIPE